MGFNTAQLRCEIVKPAQNLINAACLPTRFRFGAAQQNHRDMRRAGCGDFAIGCRAAGILGYQNVDMFGVEQRGFFGLREWSAGQDQAMRNPGFGKLSQSGRRINGSDEIKMVRRTDKLCQFQPAVGEKNALGSRWQCRDSCRHRTNLLPQVAWLLLPRGPRQLNQRNLGLRTRKSSVTRHLTGKGMGCINDGGDVLNFEIGHQAFNAAKTAGAKWHGLTRRLRAASERQGGLQLAYKRQRQRASLGCAAQNENMALPGLLLDSGLLLIQRTHR